MSQAYSYLRFSTKDQIKGDSQRRQIEASRAYCIKEGHTLVEEYQDLGLSAFHGQNRDKGELGIFLQLVESGQVGKGSYLIIESLDRLSRQDVKIAQAQLLNLLASGISIVTLMDNERVYHPESDGMDLMYSLMIMIRANEESATKSKRIQAAWDRKHIEAIETGKPKSARCPAWLMLSSDRSKYELIESRAAIVRRIFQLAIDGQGKRPISLLLNSENVPPFGRGKRWHASYITKLLYSKACIGVYETDVRLNGKRTGEKLDCIEGYFPPVIDQATYFKAKQVSALNRKSGGTQRNFANMYQGFTHCTSCGGRTLYIKKSDSDRYLKCRSYHEKSGCTSKVLFRYNILEECLFTIMSTMDITALFNTSRTDDMEGQIAIHKGVLSDKNTTLSSLIDNLVSNTGPAAKVFQKKIDTLNGEIESINRNIEDLTGQLMSAEIEVDQNYIRELANCFKGNDQATRKKLNTWLKAKVDVHLHYDPAMPKGRAISIVLKGTNQTQWSLYTNDQLKWVIMDRRAESDVYRLVEKVVGVKDTFIQNKNPTEVWEAMTVIDSTLDLINDTQGQLRSEPVD